MVVRPSSAPLHLALFLPWLASERAVLTREAEPGRPFALIEKQRGALRLVAVDREAARLGLDPGLPLADARARVPDLAALPHAPEADRALLDRVVRLCGRFTPLVAADPPAGVICDLGGCAHLFGGEEALCAALRRQVRALGVTARLALARTGEAARALARFGGEDVRGLPIAALDIDEEIRRALGRAGFLTVGEVMAQPSGPLAARFGIGLVRLLERLAGEADLPLVPHGPPVPVRVEMRFAEPVGRTGDVLDAIEALVGQAADQLAERGEGGRAFAVHLHRSDGHVARLLIETGAPTRDPALVLRLLRERIDSLADPLDPGFGYDTIDLTVPRTERIEERQPGLAEPERQAGQDMDALLDRLTVRHGAETIRHLAGADSHVPERAGFLSSQGAPQGECDWTPPGEGEPPLRPLLLLDPPQQVEVMAAVPDGPPRLFRWRDRTWRIVRQEGPERIAPEWWRRREGHAGKPGLSRDYYRVEEAGGHRFWLFRHGLYERETSDPCWYVHGLFA